MRRDEINPIQLIHKYLHELELLRNKAITARNDLVEQYHYDVVHDYRITIFEQLDRLLIYHIRTRFKTYCHRLSTAYQTRIDYICSKCY